MTNAQSSTTRFARFLAVALSAILVAGTMPLQAFAAEPSSAAAGSASAASATSSSASAATEASAADSGIRATLSDGSLAPIDLSQVSVADQEYTGKALKPVPTVTFSGLVLEAGVHFEVVGYKNNLVPGTATVTIRGLESGLFEGTCQATFAIKRSPGNYIALPGAWVKTSKGYRYKYTTGSYAKSTWLKVGSKTYYMSSKGYRTLGIREIAKRTYFFNAKTGVMETGWKKSGSKKYYFSAKEGGAALEGMKKVGSYYYCFDSTGVAKTGVRKVSGKYYYFDSKYHRKTGFITSGKYRYYFDPSTAAAKTGVFKVGSSTYVATSTGKLRCSQLVKLASGQYAFTSSAGKVRSVDLGITSGSYVLKYKGKVVTGWTKVGKSTYYFDPNKGGKMAAGVRKIDGVSYFFCEKSGVLAKNMAVKRSDGTWWWFDANGVRDREAGVAKVLAFAKKLVDNKTPYTYGGNLKSGNGTDCSGLVFYSYDSIGVEISRPSFLQQKEGVHVFKGVVTSYDKAFANAKPGDLLFSSLDSKGASNHVSIYAGTVNGSHYVYEATVPGKPAAFRSVSNTVKKGDNIIIRRLLS